MRLSIFASHPIQYQSPLHRSISERIDVRVYYSHAADALDQAKAGFDVEFRWDNDLLSGFDSRFLINCSSAPGVSSFFGCDNPEIYDILKTTRPDCVLVHGWHLKSYWQAIIAAKRLGIPVLVRGDSHLHTPRTAMLRISKLAIYPPLLRLFDAALYVGSRSLEYWLHYGYPERRLFFSPHCVDNDWFKKRATELSRREYRGQWNIPPTGKVVLFVGKLLKEKRVDDLLEAAAEVQQRLCDVTVVIAGSGPMMNNLIELSKSRGVRCIFLGFCNQSELPMIYGASDVMVLPSASETWGLVANEALACGTPILVSDCCGCAPDLATNGLVGKVFRTGDVRQLALMIEDSLVTPTDRNLISEVVSTFSLQTAIQGIERAVQYCMEA